MAFLKGLSHQAAFPLRWHGVFLIFRNAVRSQEIPDAFLEKGPATASSQ